MAIDSNSPGDDRNAGGSAERSAGPGLKLVGDRAGQGASTPATPPTPGAARPVGEIPGSSGAAVARRPVRRERRQVPLWLFAGLLVLFLAAYALQIQRAGRLEAEVLRLEGSLAGAEARLESHRTHLLEIRTGAHDLAARLEALQLLIDRDPAAASAATTDAEPVPAAETPAQDDVSDAEAP